MKSLHIVGLFAGVGGLELGLSRAGHRAVHLCELDAGARAVLQSHFQHCEISADVRRMAALDPTADILTAGFPCQDLSQAGRLKGIDGSNSGLIRHVFRLLEQTPVPLVLIENVPFMLKFDKGAAIRRITRRLERLGYRWAYRTIDSQAFGLPQRRLRVFLLASLESDPRNALLAGDRTSDSQRYDLSEAAHGFYWTEGNRGIGWAEDSVPALKGGSGWFIPSPPAVLLKDGEVVVPSLRSAERLQGFPIGWTAPASEIGYGKRRWTYVGNAVSVPVAEWIGRRLVEPGKYDSNGDEPLDSRKPWPIAAWYDGKRRASSSVSSWPCKRQHPGLQEFLSGFWTPLSIRAAAGFLSRLEASTLRIPSGFSEALTRYVQRAQAIALSA